MGENYENLFCEEVIIFYCASLLDFSQEKSKVFEPIVWKVLVLCNFKRVFFENTKILYNNPILAIQSMARALNLTYVAQLKKIDYIKSFQFSLMTCSLKDNKIVLSVLILLTQLKLGKKMRINGQKIVSTNKKFEFNEVSSGTSKIIFYLG